MNQLLVFVFAIFTLQLSAQEITTMTYNIRLDTESDGDNQWQKRKDFLTSQIAFYEPMVFGIQEGLPNQVDYLEKHLSDYDYIGVGRDDGKRKGEFSALFYKKDVFEKLDGGTFWLAENTSEPNKGWDAALPRICTWGLLRLRNTEKQVLIMNTHFDHVGEVARQKSLELIVQKSTELNKNHAPVIVMGDLNLNPESEAIQWMQTKMHDTRILAGEKAFGPEGTFNGWNVNEAVTRRIDYVFVSHNDFTLEKYAVLSDFVNLHYASDHMPVYVQLQFK